MVTVGLDVTTATVGQVVVGCSDTVRSIGNNVDFVNDVTTVVVDDGMTATLEHRVATCMVTRVDIVVVVVVVVVFADMPPTATA